MHIIKLNKSNYHLYVRKIINIHINSFSKNHFISSFNIFVLNNYYKHLILYSDISFVLIDDKNNISGYLISGYSIHKGINLFIIKYFYYLIFKSFFNIHIFKRFIYSKQNKNLIFKSKYRLYVIATAESQKGYGNLLLKNLENNLKFMNIKSYGLSVNNENINAINFYLKNGFNITKKINEKFYLDKFL